MDSTQPTERRAGELVYQAIVDLYNEGRQASRPRIVQLSGIPMSKVDEHVKRLADAGQIVRVTAGVYEPAQVWPAPRIVSLTEDTKGMFTFDIGDEVLKVTPPEFRKMYFKMKGHVDNFSISEEVRQLSASLSLLQGQVARLKAENRQLLKRAVHRGDSRQPGLFDVNSQKARA